MATIYNKTALNKIKKGELIQMFLDQQAKMNACEIENQELQEHYDNSIHIDWIAEAAGEDPEYYRDVCCADTLGAMIKENKQLNSLISEYKDSSLIHNDAEPHEILETMEEYEEAIETRDDKIEELKEENKKLIESKQIEFTEENMKIQESLDGWMATLEEYKMLKVENKKLNQLNDYAYKQINELTNKVTLSTID